MSFQSRNEWLEDAKQRALNNEKQVGNNSRELLFLYDEAAVSIEKEIAVLYSRFAAQNGLSTAEAERILGGHEHSVWRKSIEQYFAEASDTAKGSGALRELNTLAMKSRISRKEQLLGNIYRNMAQLADKADSSLETMLSNMYRVNYERSSFSLQKGLGIGFHIAKIDERTLKQILSEGWLERKFSQSVWEHCDRLSALARREISVGLLQGKGVQQMAKAIDEVMNKGRYNAIRLVRTECKFYASKGEMDAYEENGITQYDFIGTADGGKCDCHNVAKEGPYDVATAEAGTNLPPLHPNCICYVVAHFKKDILTEHPNAQPLAENIKFQEWKEKYVDNPPVPDKIKLPKNEEAAINAYLSSESYSLNRKLRAGEPLSFTEKRMAAAIDSALKKLPECKGTLYRSISDMDIGDTEQFLSALEPGQLLTFPAYTSSSTQVFDEELPIQYVIHSKHGRDLRTYNPRENEILFPRNTQFWVKKIQNRIIYLEEAD